MGTNCPQTGERQPPPEATPPWVKGWTRPWHSVLLVGINDEEAQLSNVFEQARLLNMASLDSLACGSLLHALMLCPPAARALGPFAFICPENFSDSPMQQYSPG